MLFNSLDFLIFLPTVFVVYWRLLSKSLKLQNSFILLSSYIFYGWWDWRFLTLISMSTIIDYFIGLGIYNAVKNNTKKFYLWISIIFNLSMLGFFKYFDFFINSWVDFLILIGFESQATISLKIILPVGISFYTFQTMSYSIDIYYKKLKPNKDFISYATFVSFFPQLVAGPIERAKNLLPQINRKRSFKYIQGIEGLRLILWGLFKKVVIADALSMHVNMIFEDYTSYNGGVLLLGLIYFSFQIYCDFSGYSDIAIGTAKLFGLELMSNFKFPYFAKSLPEFWKRWHISLSTWFRDYLYIPLGGSKKGEIITIRNLFIVFVISGMWHGANWTFIIWGLVHVIFYIPSFLIHDNYFYEKEINNRKSFSKSFKNLFQIGLTFFITTLSWVFFRSESINDALGYLVTTFNNFGFPDSNRGGVPFILFLIFIEKYIHKNERDLFSIQWIHSEKIKQFCRIFMYYVMVLSIFHFSKFEKPFIYFQF